MSKEESPSVSIYRWRSVSVIVPVILLIAVLFAVNLIIATIRSYNESSETGTKAEAKKMENIEFTVVSGQNEKTGTLFPLGLDNSTTKEFQTFEPCTEDQKVLKIGEKVTFKYVPDTMSAQGRIDLPSCFLRIVAVE